MRRSAIGRASFALGVMALTQEDIDHATDMLAQNERRLRVRDKQIVRHGDNVAPEIVLEAEDLRRKIIVLKAVLEPEIPDELSGLVKRRLEDDYFIFQQTLGAKQDVAILRDDVVLIKQAQSLAATDRMQTNDRLERIEVQVGDSELKRAAGSTLYRVALIIVAVAAIAAFLLALRALGGF